MVQNTSPAVRDTRETSLARRRNGSSISCASLHVTSDRDSFKGVLLIGATPSPLLEAASVAITDPVPSINYRNV